MTARFDVAPILAAHRRKINEAGDGYTAPRERWDTCACGVTTWSWQQFYAEAEEDPDEAWNAHLVDVVNAAVAEWAAEVQAKVDRVEALVGTAEMAYVTSAHKPNVDYETGLLDLMRFTRGALAGESR